jgi:hypothetical protein
MTGLQNVTVLNYRRARLAGDTIRGITEILIGIHP